MASHPPIPILELADHIERLKANDNLKFSQEYEVIFPTSLLSCLLFPRLLSDMVPSSHDIKTMIKKWCKRTTWWGGSFAHKILFSFYKYTCQADSMDTYMK